LVLERAVAEDLDAALEAAGGDAAAMLLPAAAAVSIDAAVADGAALDASDGTGSAGDGSELSANGLESPGFVVTLTISAAASCGGSTTVSPDANGAVLVSNNDGPDSLKEGATLPTSGLKLSGSVGAAAISVASSCAGDIAAGDVAVAAGSIAEADADGDEARASTSLIEESMGASEDAAIFPLPMSLIGKLALGDSSMGI
jgi:hypothetical protein